jgi:hypothetical protein
MDADLTCFMNGVHEQYKCTWTDYLTCAQYPASHYANHFIPLRTKGECMLRS